MKLVALLSLMACTSPARELGSSRDSKGQGQGSDTPSNGGVVGPEPEGTAGGSSSPVPSGGSDPPALPDGPVHSVPVTCSVAAGGVVGDGQITRVTRTLSDFTRVTSLSPGDVVIQEGPQFRVQIETDSNIQSMVVTSVNSAGTLGISSSNTPFCMHFMRTIVTMPALDAAMLAASGNVTVTKPSATDVELTSRGSGNLTFSGNAVLLEVLLAASGNIHLTSGAASATDVQLQGSGTVDATGFSPGAVTRNVSGTGAIAF